MEYQIIDLCISACKVVSFLQKIFSCQFEARKHQLFLAGGITDCPDWQQDVIGELSGYPDLTIFNPRRAHFPIHDPGAANEQITWEYDHFKKSTAIAMWFSRGSENPIVLYELGRWINANPSMQAFIGIGPLYSRRQDVEVQTKLDRPTIKIASSLGELVPNIKTDLLGDT